MINIKAFPKSLNESINDYLTPLFNYILSVWPHTFREFTTSLNNNYCRENGLTFDNMFTFKYSVVNERCKACAGNYYASIYDVDQKKGLFIKAVCLSSRMPTRSSF